jgi:hypothetical protein
LVKENKTTPRMQGEKHQRIGMLLSPCWPMLKKRDMNGCSLPVSSGTIFCIVIRHGFQQEMNCRTGLLRL